MSFIPKKSGEWEVFFPTRTVSQAFVTGAALDWPAIPSGCTVKATTITTKFAGIAQDTVKTTDTDYAIAGIKTAALRPKKHAKGILIATTSSATAADIGRRCDLADEVTVDRGNSSIGRVIIDEFYSATSVGVHFLEPVETGST